MHVMGPGIVVVCTYCSNNCFDDSIDWILATPPSGKAQPLGFLGDPPQVGNSDSD